MLSVESLYDVFLFVCAIFIVLTLPYTLYSCTHNSIYSPKDSLVEVRVTELSYVSSSNIRIFLVHTF